jgi:hypothetical protein
MDSSKWTVFLNLKIGWRRKVLEYIIKLKQNRWILGTKKGFILNFTQIKNKFKWKLGKIMYNKDLW